MKKEFIECGKIVGTHGVRGFGPMNAVGYGAFDTLEYVKTNHDKMCRFIQIEHVDAVKNLDEIMQNQFIDGYIIGANDLSGSINELCNVFGENTTALITETITKLKANITPPIVPPFSETIELSTKEVFDILLIPP